MSPPHSCHFPSRLPIQSFYSEHLCTGSLIKKTKCCGFCLFVFRWVGFFKRILERCCVPSHSQWQGGNDHITLWASWLLCYALLIGAPPLSHGLKLQGCSWLPLAQTAGSNCAELCWMRAAEGMFWEICIIVTLNLLHVFQAGSS